MQRERRENPYPFDWQLTAGAGVLVLLAIPVLGLHLGRFMANLTAGAGPTVPAQAQIFASLPGLMRGDATAGLDPIPRGPVAGAVALWVWSAITCLALAALAVWAAVWWWNRHGPGKVLGMATRDDAEQLLGRSRLRKNRHVIRPDLYPKHKVGGRLMGIITWRDPEPDHAILERPTHGQ